MELKLRGRCENRICFSVLIVPYGIETYIPVMNKIAIIVLIVPYGIETSINRLRTCKPFLC